MFPVISFLTGKLKSEDARTLNVVRNTFFSGLMKACSLLCSLIVVPITINYLNTENYGIWMAMTSIIYWFAFFDIGLGNGMRNYLAEAISDGDYDKARTYFSTAMVILSVIAVLIGCAVVPAVYMFDLTNIFNTHGIDGHYLADVLAVAVVFSLVQFVVKNIGLVYIAMQRYAVNDFIIFLGNVLSLLAVFVLTKTTQPSLAYVVIAFTGIPVLMFLLAIIPLLRRYPQLKPSIQHIDTVTARRIVSKGLGFFVIQITSCLVIFGSANVLISHYCGPEQVTVYNVAYKLFNVLVIGYTILISPLWNAYTDAATKGDYEWIRRTFRKSLMMWCASVILGLVVLALSGWFFRIWVGDSVTIPFAISSCVLLYVCTFNLNNCATYLVNGLNKIRVQIISSILTTMFYLVAVFVIKDRYGIIGISLSMAVAYVVMSVTHLYQCRLLVERKAKGIWNK